MSLRKTILVTRRTRYEELISQYNTESQARFVLESRGDCFDDYQDEFSTYQTCITQIKTFAEKSCRVQLLEREYLPNFVFGKDDIVIVVGQDGLVANTIKYLDEQPVIGINPDPRRFDGVLLPFRQHDLSQILTDVINNSFTSQQITMAEAILNDGQQLLAVNDFFIGPRFQSSARYEITYSDKHEYQSSSGVIVSTGLGSTGWLTSAYVGAKELLDNNTSSINPAYGWNKPWLRFIVREPFPSNATGTSINHGDIKQGEKLTLHSKMGQGGVIFSDGMLDDYIEFNSGSIVNIQVANQIGCLVNA